MKICIVTPDDLSTIIFAKSFSLLLRDVEGAALYTICAEGGLRDELHALPLHNIHVPMERRIHPLKDLLYFWRLFRLFRRERFDAVINFTTKPNVFGALAAKLAGVPRILVAVRGMGSSFNADPRLWFRALRWLMTRLYRWSCAAANLVWFTNINDRHFMLEQGMVAEEKTFLTGNAINIRDFSMAAVAPETLARLRREVGLAPAGRAVVMVARLIWSKGVREFAEAAERLRERLPDVTFLLVAPVEPGGPDRVPEAYIRTMEQRANFLWLGFRKDVRDIYAMADLAVLPSYYKEGGYPRALLEPMGLGKPVICSDSPDCRNPVEDGGNGFWVPPRDADALAEKMARILTDPPLAERFGRRSRELVEARFDDLKVAAAVLDRIGVTVQPPAQR